MACGETHGTLEAFIICAYLRKNLRKSAGNDACTANITKGQKVSRRFSQIFPQIFADFDNCPPFISFTCSISHTNPSSNY
jgi:hypothetical protein